MNNYKRKNDLLLDRHPLILTFFQERADSPIPGIGLKVLRKAKKKLLASFDASDISNLLEIEKKLEDNKDTILKMDDVLKVDNDEEVSWI